MEPTPNFGFNKPDRGTNEWDTPLNENWDKLDLALTNIDPQKLAGQPASGYVQKTDADAVYLSKAEAATAYLSVNSGVLPGSIHALAYNGAAPTGYLPCDGTAVSRTTYSTLFALIGTIYGVGNGSTTFNLPDLRGEFLRGLDNGRGVDTGRTIGSAQSDELESHTHTVKPDVNQAAGTVTTPAPTAVGGGTSYTGRTYTTSATGGTETRPRNVAVFYVIKY